MTEKPVVATSVVGSYSVPEWLERLKTDFYQRRISGQYLDDIHEVAIKAALKDQERAGVDVVPEVPRTRATSSGRAKPVRLQGLHTHPFARSKSPAASPKRGINFIMGMLRVPATGATRDSISD